MKISSSVMLMICVIVLAGGFVWATFYPGSPYGVLAPSIVALASAYWVKRTVQKNENFGGGVCPPEKNGKGGDNGD